MELHTRVQKRRFAGLLRIPQTMDIPKSTDHIHTGHLRHQHTQPGHRKFQTILPTETGLGANAIGMERQSWRVALMGTFYADLATHSDSDAAWASRCWLYPARLVGRWKAKVLVEKDIWGTGGFCSWQVQARLYRRACLPRLVLEHLHLRTILRITMVSLCSDGQYHRTCNRGWPQGEQDEDKPYPRPIAPSDSDIDNVWNLDLTIKEHHNGNTI